MDVYWVQAGRHLEHGWKRLAFRAIEGENIVEKGKRCNWGKNLKLRVTTALFDNVARGKESDPVVI